MADPNYEFKTEGQRTTVDRKEAQVPLDTIFTGLITDSDEASTLPGIILHNGSRLSPQLTPFPLLHWEGNNKKIKLADSATPRNEEKTEEVECPTPGLLQLLNAVSLGWESRGPDRIRKTDTQRYMVRKS